MGVTVRQKIKGKGKPWWVFVSHNGKRKSKMIGDKATAEKVAREVRERLAKGDLNIGNEKKILTFREYAEKWLEGYIRLMRRQSTYESYGEKLKKHILPVLGDMPLDMIKRELSKTCCCQS